MKGKKSLVACLSLVGLFLPLSLFAQTQQRSSTVERPTRALFMRGQVRSAETEMTLDMVRVTLERIAGGIVGQVFTDSNGNFEFAGLTPGTYRITAFRDGYQEAAQDVELYNTPRVALMVYMHPKRKETQSSVQASISVRSFTVPKKAQKEYEKGVKELFEKRNYDQSMPHFRKAIELYPEYYEAYSSLGIALLDTKNYEEAKTCFLKSIELNDKYGQAYFALGGLYNGQREFQRAEEILQKGLAVDGGAWQGHFELAKTYWGMGNYAKAEEQAVRAREIYQEFPALQLLLANIFLRRQAYPEALTAMDAFLKLNPSSPMSSEVRQVAEKVRASLAASQKSPK